MEFELRPWRMEDVEAVARYANNPKVAANLRDIFPYPYTRQDAEEFLQSCIHADPSRQCFRAIVIQGEAAGSISLSFGSDIARRSAELGYWLAEPFWGQGIMTAAVRQFCEYGFASYDLVRIHAEPFVYNLASCRVLQKEGTMRCSVYKRGVLWDSYLYARLKTGCVSGGPHS